MKHRSVATLVLTLALSLSLSTALADKAPEQSTEPAPTAAQTQTDDLIEKAKRLAFEDAGVDPSKAQNVKVRQERDDGRLVYEVDFDVDNTEYDYEIDPDTFSVLHAEKSRNDRPAKKQNEIQKGSEEERAMDAALKHAGIQLDQAEGQRVKLEHEDGRLVYEVDWHTADTSYEYEVDATNFSVVTYERKGIKRNVEGTDKTTSVTPVALTEAEMAALQAAMQHAGVAEKDVELVKVKLDYDDGRQVYDIEFFAGDQEYEYEVAADTQLVVSFEKEKRDARPSATTKDTSKTKDEPKQTGNQQGSTGKNTTSGKQEPAAPANPGTDTKAKTEGQSISREEAIKRALGEVSGATDKNVHDVERDKERGKQVYEIEIEKGGIEYDIVVDANTGEIISKKAEKDD